MNRERKGTLYILGNGFDCCHDLDTSTERFLEILRTKDVYNETETAEMIFRRYNVLWGDYESCLADIDLELIAEENLIEPDYFLIMNMIEMVEYIIWKCIQKACGGL